MPEGVFTRMKRVQFVKGWLTGGTDPADGSVECGDYTDFPIEVTGATVQDRFDKIAEVYYRVKYAQFTSNELMSIGSGEGSTVTGVTTGLISPRIMTASDGGAGFDSALMSGYWSLDDLGLPSAVSAIPFLGDQYSVDMGSWFNGGSGGNTSPVVFRDIINREAGLFLKPNDGENPTWNKAMNSYLGISYFFYVGAGAEYGLDDQDFKTAFSHYSISPAGTLTQPTIPIPWISQIYFGDTLYEQLIMQVQFSGEIGWVGESLYHPDTKLYLGMRLDGQNSYNNSTISSWNDAYSSIPSRYIMRLSTGDISCPLNADVTDNYSGDLVHEAIEWFSYQDGDGNVWNPMTGLRD
jgi:hypothetical protein